MQKLLRSGLRLTARTPRERLIFTKKGPHSAKTLESLIAVGLSAKRIRLQNVLQTFAARFSQNQHLAVGSSRQLARPIVFPHFAHRLRSLRPALRDQDFGSRLGRRENGLSFTKNGAHSVLPSGPLMSLELGANGLRTDWFNPFASGHPLAIEGRGHTSVRRLRR